MKLSLRSKLIARVTPGVRVCTDLPIAESARVLIMPPCTKPEWLAMSSVAVMSTVAVPFPASMTCRPSHCQAREGATSLTTLSLRHRHACRRGPRHHPVLLVQDICLAEEQRLFHLDDTPDCANPPRDDGPDEVDLQLDGRVPDAVLLKCCQGHPHGGVGDLGDDAALHNSSPVAVLRTRLELEHDAPRLGLGDARANRL